MAGQPGAVPGPREVFARMKQQWLANRFDAMDSLLADDGVVESPFAPPDRPRRIAGREEFMAFARAERALLPVRFEECRETAHPRDRRSRRDRGRVRARRDRDHHRAPGQRPVHRRAAGPGRQDRALAGIPGPGGHRARPGPAPRPDRGGPFRDPSTRAYPPGSRPTAADRGGAAMTEYVLDHHQEGERTRLALMSRLLDPMHRRHLEALGVGPGQGPWRSAAATARSRPGWPTGSRPAARRWRSTWICPCAMRTPRAGVPSGRHPRRARRARGL